MRLTLVDDDNGILRAMDGERVVKMWSYDDETLTSVYRRARSYCDGWYAAHPAQRREDRALPEAAPIAISDADWLRLREAAATYPAVAWIVALVREAVDATDYAEIASIADSAAKSCYDLPDQCALCGVPGQDLREPAE